MLIGVDHGNKQIKTVHCEPFVSGLKQSVTRPFGQNVLRYQNTYYTLSTERIPYRKDKTEDDRFFILTLFALAGEIEARGAYSTEVQRIQLAVGLPPAHFGAQVERFTQYFGQRGMVEFEVQGKPYTIYIEDVACFPQAYAAAATMLHTLVEEPKAVSRVFPYCVYPPPIYLYLVFDDFSFCQRIRAFVIVKLGYCFFSEIVWLSVMDISL